MALFRFLFDSKKSIQKIYDDGALLLDVRTQAEWDAGHINNAIHIPLTELKKRIVELKQLEKPVIAYCKSGVRSARAVTHLKESGITAINGGGCKSLSKIIL